MSELKDYWNRLDTSGVDESFVNESLRSVTSRISRRQRWKTGLISLAVAIPIIGAGFTAVHNISHVEEPLLCYAQHGEHKTLTLEDGTSITLNSGSSLTYFTNSDRGRRQVILQGEARFEVTHNPKRPFIVHTNSFDVEVLGTVFDVASFPEDSVQSVVLESGSVKLITEGGKETFLKHGEKAEISKDGDVSVTAVNTSLYHNWTKGGYLFDRASFDDIVKYIERNYAVNVWVEDSPKFHNASITARQDSPQSIQEFLSLMSKLIPGMRYSISGQHVTIY